MSVPGGRSSGNSSGGPSYPQRIQFLLDGNRLRAQPFSPVVVSALWRKAVDSAKDAELTKISSDGALRAAYDAGHLAALALLAAHGLRTTNGQGHHEVAFTGAAAFGDPGLEELVPDSSEIRSLRKGSMYDPILAGLKRSKMRLPGCGRHFGRSTPPSLRSTRRSARALHRIPLEQPNTSPRRFCISQSDALNANA